MTESDIESFNDILSDEIDSAFGSSIGCCDYCLADFKSHWPAVAHRDEDFQPAESHWLVEYSRLPGIYSPAEIATLINFVRCPRCLAYDPCNVYIYEHRFSDPQEIEDAIDELRALGKSTPFLLLEHPFARRVLHELREHARAAPSTAAGLRLHRARISADVARCGQAASDLPTYGAPPAEKVGEGRFNHAGAPMLYLASTAELAATEIGIPGEVCVVGEVEITVALKVLDLVEIDEFATAAELMQALANSALIAAPHTGEGWVKQEYIFSRFVADCAASAGFDAIRYGSTRLPMGSNYVILRPEKNLSTWCRLLADSVLSAPAPSSRW